MQTVLVFTFAGLGALLCGLVLLMTSGYTMDPPQGADAMGLIVPFVMVVVGALAFVVATLVAARAGRLDWIAAGGRGAVRALPLAVGVGCAAVGALICWMAWRGWWVVPLSLAGGALGPALLTLLLVASGPGAPSTAMQLASRALVPVAGLGYGLVVVGVGVWFMAGARNAASEREALLAREARQAREAAMTPAERLTESFAEFSPTAPAWSVVAAFLEWGHDADARAVIIERTLQVPDLDEELARTLDSKYARYRTAGLLFVRWIDDARRRPAWGAAVARSIEVTTAAIAADSTWLTTGEEVPPGPVGNVEAIREAAARFPQDRSVQQALVGLERAVRALPAGTEHRDSALAVLGAR